MTGVYLSVPVVAWVVYMIVRRFQPQMVLILAGLVLLACTALCHIGEVLPPDKTTGFVPFDLFELIRALMKTRIGGLGLTLMAIAGFARCMEHVGASQALYALVASPLKRVRSPYVLLVLSFLVTQILVLFIPSHAGLGMLLMVTMYPVLVRTGVSKLSALGVIGCCQFIDHGPGSGNVNMAAEVSGLDPALYFVRHQLPVTLPIILAVAVTHYFVQRWRDGREGHDPTACQVDDAIHVDEARPPLIYAFLPVVPLFLLLGFSPLFKSAVRMDVATAMFISTAVALAFEYVRLRDARSVFNSLQLFFDGMGKLFATVVSLIVAGETFAQGLLKIGAVDALVRGAQSIGFGVTAMILVMCLIVGTAAFLMGSGNAAFFSFAALAPQVAAHLDIETVVLILPMQITAGLGRTVSPITAAIVAIAGVAQVTPLEIVKRTAIPMAVAVAVNLLMVWLVVVP